MDETDEAAAVHLQNLQNICRICGKKPTGALRSKDGMSRMIMKIFGIDIQNDTTYIHPPKVCDVCRIKLNRSDKKMKNKSASNDNLSLKEFVAHNSTCTICDNQVDLQKLSKIGSENGYVPTLSGDTLTLAKLNPEGTCVVCYAVLKENAPCKLIVGSRDVTKHQLTSSNDSSTLMKVLMTKRLCPGNLGFNDVLQNRRNKEITIGFYDKDNKEVAREEAGSTIRHINCLGFVDQPGDHPCENCANYRRNLRKFRSRNLERSFEEIGNMSTSMFTRNDRLSDQQKLEKLTNLKNDKKLLQRQLKGSQEKLRVLIEKEGIEVAADLDRDLRQIASSHTFEDGSIQQIFWQQQEQMLSKDGIARRWHPAMIRFCIGLHAKSPGAYDTLRTSGVLALPSSRTLRDYTYFTNPSSGLNPDIMERIAEETKVDTLSDVERNVVLAFDEIKICQGLVYAGETDELVGWVDVGDLNNHILKVTKEDQRMPLATHIMCVMIRGLFIKLNQVFTFFPSIGCAADELFYLIWESVMFVELYGYQVRALTCDGAATNRKFYRLGIIAEDEVHWAPNPRRSIDRKVYYVCDVPHLIKTTRNNWENSGWHSKSKDLTFNGHPIKWTHLLQLVEENHPVIQRRPEGTSSEPIAILQTTPKLTPNHLYLTPTLRMKVKLASQVLSNTVKVAFALSPTLSETTKSTQHFVSMFDRFFDCLNVRHQGQDKRTRKPELAPYRNTDDWRFEWLEKDFLNFLDVWEKQSLERTDLSKRDRSRLCLSRETLEGLRITVRSFVQLGGILLDEGAEFLLSSRFNQDPLEQYFSKQRSLLGKQENPDVRSFSYNFLKLISSGSASIRAASRGNTSHEVLDDLVMQPLRKRPKLK